MLWQKPLHVELISSLGRERVVLCGPRHNHPGHWHVQPDSEFKKVFFNILLKQVSVPDSVGGTVSGQRSVFRRSVAHFVLALMAYH